MTSKQMKPRVWQGVDGDYIGSTGTNSIGEFAVAILDSDDPGIFEVIELDQETMDEPTMLAVISRFLETNRACACAVPVSVFGDEYWGDRQRSIDMDAKPGRGYVKVIGVTF